MQIWRDLERREENNDIIRVAVVGTGFFGAGLVRQMLKMKGLKPVVLANRTLQRAIDVLLAAGIPLSRIQTCNDLSKAQKALESRQFVVTSQLNLPAQIQGVDVVMEATGNVTIGAQIASECIARGKHIVAANPETQATVGCILKYRADQAGVVYSDVDGDQPGVLMNLSDYCRGMSFQPVIAGNCKGVLKRYATPETQASFSTQNGIQPWIATAAADGTKLNIEMAIVANATGMMPAALGMKGIQTNLESILKDFSKSDLLNGGRYVEYTLGIPSGVFMIAKNDEKIVQNEFQYLKMGSGPYYLFYHPYILCHYDAPLSAAEAVLYHTATIAPMGAPVAEVGAFAKRNLKSGQKLDGIGGFDVYGLIASAKIFRRDDYLPIGMAEFARLKRDIRKDEPIRYGDIDWEASGNILTLRKEQDRLFNMSAA